MEDNRGQGGGKSAESRVNANVTDFEFSVDFTSAAISCQMPNESGWKRLVDAERRSGAPMMSPNCAFCDCGFSVTQKTVGARLGACILNSFDRPGSGESFVRTCVCPMARFVANEALPIFALNSWLATLGGCMTFSVAIYASHVSPASRKYLPSSPSNCTVASATRLVHKTPSGIAADRR